MKRMMVVLMLCCALTACGKAEDVKVDNAATTSETVEETLAEEPENTSEEESENTSEAEEPENTSEEESENTSEAEETKNTTESKESESTSKPEEPKSVSKPEEPENTSKPEEPENTSEEESESTSETVTEATTVAPLPTTIDLNDLDHCTLAVSFEEGDAYVDDTGKMRLDVTVYTYDVYDMVDISNLKEGDTIVIGSENVLIESLEKLETGDICINGGIENGGYDLGNTEDGVYFEHGMSDTKSYYAIGETSIPVSTEFRFIDSSDLDSGEVTFYPGDFLVEDAGITYHFTPNNTSIVVEDGEITRMMRVYTP